MKTKNILSECLAIFVLFLSSCSKPAASVSGTDFSIVPETKDMSSESDLGRVSFPTSIYVVTDVSGQAVTDSNGQTVTSIGTVPSRTVTDPASPPSRSAGNGSSRQTVVHTMAGAPSADGTTNRQPNRTTASRSKTTTATDAVTTTTSRTTTQQPTETLPQPKPTGSWYSPYDLPQIYAECKREIERLGLVWEDDLRPDSLGVSWDNPENTVVYTYYPKDFCLRDYVFNELIPFYKEQPYTRQSCRIWLEPYEESPGDYLIYFLERR